MKSRIRKAAMFWSGGKDSAYCLQQALADVTIEVCCLITTINKNYNRISMHGIREALLDAQVKQIGLPLIKMYVTSDSNNEYEQKLQEVLTDIKHKQIITHVIFGDIFLEDLKAYREKLLVTVGLKAIFPLWQMDTTQLAQTFIEVGFKTITCCVNDSLLDESYVGNEFDNAFISRLPKQVDPCGENGEFHTFCYDGPIFISPINFTLGKKLYKPLKINFSHQDTLEPATPTKGFWYVDLLEK